MAASGNGARMTQRLEFAFDPRFRAPLLAFGVTPSSAWVSVSDTDVEVRFGLFHVCTPLANVREVCRTGPYSWYRAIGPRMSFTDGGVTFGTTTAGGVCLLFNEPIKALDPTGTMRHPGMTLTLADLDAAEAAFSGPGLRTRRAPTSAAGRRAGR